MVHSPASTVGPAAVQVAVALLGAALGALLRRVPLPDRGHPCIPLREITRPWRPDRRSPPRCEVSPPDGARWLTGNFQIGLGRVVTSLPLGPVRPRI